jgi:hypothetical protein
MTATPVASFIGLPIHHLLDIRFLFIFLLIFFVDNYFFPYNAASM